MSDKNNNLSARILLIYTIQTSFIIQVSKVSKFVVSGINRYHTVILIISMTAITENDERYC